MMLSRRDFIMFFLMGGVFGFGFVFKKRRVDEERKAMFWKRVS